MKVTQQEAEQFYAQRKAADEGNPRPLSHGLNTTLVKRNGVVEEDVWKVDGRYGKAIQQIVYWLPTTSAARTIKTMKIPITPPASPRTSFPAE